VLRVLRLMPLAASRRDGPVSWRTISIFNGVIDTEDANEKKSEAVIRAAFTETGPQTLQARLETFDAGIAELTAIGDAFDANGGYGTGPDLSTLIKLLREISSFLRNYMPAADAGPGGDDQGEPTPGEVGASDGEMSLQPRAGPARSAGFSIASLTAINSREDAMKLLDLVCRYYEVNEPSSPLPLLVGRARKLAEMDFIGILRELAPDGLSQAQNVVGQRDE
jgi:type VI secretion system protein ImpA